LRVATSDKLEGDVTIDLDQGRLLLRGTVLRGGDWQDTGCLRVVGGAGGLSKVAKAKHYTSTSVRIVLGALLSDAGEKLSPTADESVLNRSLPAWTTAAIPVGRLITQLLLSASPSATWRVQPDGAVWVAHEAWPDSGLTADDYQLLLEDPAHAEAIQEIAKFMIARWSKWAGLET
jgi:hypothetical protein